MKYSNNGNNSTVIGKSGPLKRNLFYYFIIFTVFFILLLWILLVFSLNYTYKSTRLDQITRTGRMVVEKAKTESIDGWLKTDPDNRDTSIVVYNMTDHTTKTANPFVLDANMMRFDVNKLLHTAMQFDENSEIMMYMNLEGRELARFNIMTKKSDRSYYSDDVKAVIYSCKSVNNENEPIIILVIGSIVPLDATASTLKQQLIIVSIILLLVSILVSIIASRRLARPIVEVTHQASQLGRGIYDTEFNARGYQEIEELSQTLDAMAKELVKADQMQKDLIANVSHDLRTPLTMISGYGELIRDIPNENTPENVQIIIDEANRLTSLVNNLLDISKLQSGNEELSLGAVNCEDLVYGVANSYQKMMETQGYDLEVQGETTDCYIEADLVRIQQVLYNLVNNAINHCGEDKKIIIRYRKEDDQVRFDVIDHGEGIAEEDLPMIWQRYYKADKLHRFVTGSGIGLSIVRTILDLHHAQYGVESKLNEGSDFWFKIKMVEN